MNKKVTAPFRLALIGYSPELWPLLQAMSESPEFQLVSAFELPEDQPAVAVELRKLHPQVVTFESWEVLLHQTAADGVLFAKSSDPARDEIALRKLAQVGLPLIVLYPPCEMVFGFELLMIQRDSRTVIRPYFPGLLNELALLEHVPRDRNATDQLPAQNSNDERFHQIGAVTECTIDRVGSSTDREIILDLFCRDVLLIPQWMAPVRRISALGLTTNAGPVTHLNVQMATEGDRLARWTYRTVSGTAQHVEYQLFGTMGKLAWTRDSDLDRLAWARHHGQKRLGDENVAQSEGSLTESAVAFLTGFRDEMAGMSVGPSWEQACRAMELRDSVIHGCRRGKTIDLQLDDVSEEKTFKAMMSAAGCLLLLFVLLLLPVLGAADALFVSSRRAEAGPSLIGLLIDPRRWPIFIGLGLLAFLAMQLLGLVFRTGPHRDSDEMSS